MIDVTCRFLLGTEMLDVHHPSTTEGQR